MIDAMWKLIRWCEYLPEKTSGPAPVGIGRGPLLGTSLGPHAMHDAERPARLCTLCTYESAAYCPRPGETRCRYLLGVKWSQVQILSARHFYQRKHSAVTLRRGRKWPWMARWMATQFHFFGAAFGRLKVSNARRALSLVGCE